MKKNPPIPDLITICHAIDNEFARAEKNYCAPRMDVLRGLRAQLHKHLRKLKPAPALATTPCTPS